MRYATLIPQNAMPEPEAVFEQGTLCCKDGRLFLNGRMIVEASPSSIYKSYRGKGHETFIKNLYNRNEYFSLIDIKNTMYAMFAFYESAKHGGKEVII